MSYIQLKGKQIWSTIKYKIQDWISVHGEQNQMFILKPVVAHANSAKNVNFSTNENKHLSLYNKIWNTLNLLTYVVGIDIHKDNGMNCRIVFTWSVIAVAFPSLFYTIVLVWPNLSKILEVVCIFGVLLPGTLKFKLALSRLRYMRLLKKMVESVFSKNTNGRRAELLQKDIEVISTKIKLFAAIFLVCFGIFSLYPIYAYVVENRLVAIMRIEFPFVDQTEMKGYLIALAIMLLFGFLAVAGSVAFDLVVSMILLLYGTLIQLFIQDLEDYYDMWQKNEAFSERDQEHFLRNICIKYQDINSYIRYYNKLFGNNACYSICILYASLICSVYAVCNNGWISGYGFCLFCFIQLYIPCILGTFIKDQNEKLNQALYFTHWYEYPVKVQKTFLMLLHATTFNAMELWIGPFAPLNVATGLNMTKNIYSYNATMNNLS